jgi:GR25 family glycosyltransferase involved in LPS biosynthesis
MNKLIINLDIERKRLEKHNNFTLIDGVYGKSTSPEFQDRFKFRYNIGMYKKNGSMGCFASHMKALQYIVDGDLKHTIILEDDGTPIEELPEDLMNFQEACYIGGWLVKPMMKDIKQPVDREDFIEGINKIDYSKFRILETRAYYVPNKQEAMRMLMVISTADHLKNIDVFYCKNKMIKYFYYPAISKQILGLKSYIDPENRFGLKSAKTHY